MPVAPAHRHRRWIPGQPPGQRGRPVRIHPAPVPDLGQRRPPLHRPDPADVAADRMIHRQEPAAALGGVQPPVGRLAEVDPADVPERVRVPVLRGHLLPGDQDDPVPGGRVLELGVMADGVVVGHGQVVEPLGGGEAGQLGHRQVTVGVHGVGVQVPGQPAVPGPGGQLAAGRPLAERGRDRGRRIRAQPAWCAAHRGGHRVAGAVGGEPVEAEGHLPQARFQLTRQVAGRGLARGDDERGPGATGPAAEPAGAEAAQVEHGGGTVVVELDPQRRRAGRNLDRQVVPR